MVESEARSVDVWSRWIRGRATDVTVEAGERRSGLQGEPAMTNGGQGFGWAAPRIRDNLQPGTWTLGSDRPIHCLVRPQNPFQSSEGERRLIWASDMQITRVIRGQSRGSLSKENAPEKQAAQLPKLRLTQVLSDLKFITYYRIYYDHTRPTPSKIHIHHSRVLWLNLWEVSIGC